MRHGDVACCKFNFMLGEFMHWAIYDKEAKAFIEFCGRRVKGGGGGDKSNRNRSADSDVSTSKGGDASKSVEEPNDFADNRQMKGQNHPRGTEICISTSVEANHNTASAEVPSTSPDTSGVQLHKNASSSSSTATSAESIARHEWSIGDAINFSSGEIERSAGSIPWPSLPGLAGSSARYLWSRGTVPIANAVVQQTSVEEFFKAWEGVSGAESKIFVISSILCFLVFLVLSLYLTCIFQ